MSDIIPVGSLNNISPVPSPTLVHEQLLFLKSIESDLALEILILDMGG